MKTRCQLKEQVLKLREQLTTKLKIQETLQRLTEMAVHCKKEDGFGIIVVVGSSIDRNQSNGSRKEHNPPHAHVYSVDKTFNSRFQILEKDPPKTASELKKVDESDSDFGKFGKKIIEWVNSEPIRAMKKGDTTNWEAMRNSWRDIQDVVNDSLKNKLYI